MDDFDILARDFGFRPHGKSVSVKSDGNRPPSSSATVTEDKHMFSDVFGGPPKHTNNNFKSSSAMADLDYDAIFKNPASTNNDEVKRKTTSVKLPVYDDHIFDGLPGSKSKSMSSSALPRYEENIFASMTHKRNQQSDQFDDLMVNSRRTQKIEATKQNRSKSPIGFDNLIPSFGIGRPTTSNRSFDQSTSPPSSSQMADEIWLTVSEIPLFTQPTKSPPPSKPPPPIPKPKNLLPRSHSRKFGNGLSPKHPQSPLSDPPHSLQQMDSVSAMKEAMDRAEAKFRHAKEVREREREREREVTKASRNKDEEREKGKQAAERATKEARERAVQRAQAELAAVGAERAATSRAAHSDGVVDDLSSLFEQFQKVEGETEEKRRARIEREQRTQERTAKALAEKNERDLQSQREQEERNRIGGTLDTEIKRWAFGKEGNLRALLSTLQYVLWPESGWQAVSLTELITGANVKKAYRKATLCIHPDKVQQKGATLQQKYVAEKVFDILKEAWNKFNSEELF